MFIFVRRATPVARERAPTGADPHGAGARPHNSHTEEKAAYRFPLGVVKNFGKTSGSCSQDEPRSSALMRKR